MPIKSSNLGQRLQNSPKQVSKIGAKASQQIDSHLLKRFEHLSQVRRFVIGWIALVILLIIADVAQSFNLSGYYQSLQPVPGGIYNEGVLGRFTTANPLFASSDADATVARLIFAGLLTYDKEGQLVGDLASGYSVSEHGTVYTLKLKPNLKWQDGKPLTSDDVLFTYRLIQNPDVGSPLLPAWQGVGISAPDSSTVVFKLPDALASFPYNLTNGIVPAHLLSGTNATDLRSTDFNTVHPVGAGPFAWQALHQNSDGNLKHDQTQIALAPFSEYQSGPPKLQKFIIQIFADKDQLISSFKDGQLTGMESPSSNYTKSRRVRQYSLILRAGTYVFFKTSGGVLADTNVRQALIRGADTSKVVAKLGYPAPLVKEPLLLGQVGYDPQLNQAQFNPAEANKILDSSGWVIGKRGIRSKNGLPLSFNLTAADTPDYRLIAQELGKEWSKVGVKLKLQLLDPNDLQNVLSTHSYDSILYGISIGEDPDVFVYWDSSQADARTNRLNLSEYKSQVADAALESGRTRLDPTLRAIKYRPFLQAWQHDSPALGLYQPRVLYVTNGPVDGLVEQQINSPTDRFDNVQNWQIRQAKVTN